MKKLFILLLAISTFQIIYSQVYKSGTISSPETWSGIVYLSDDVTITSTVTINAGTRVLYKENDITLTVDGSGSIDANGTEGNEIYFSADHDEDGNYGENGADNSLGGFNERGLKLKFYPTSGSTGTSFFDYCIIEFIDNSAQTGSTAYGAIDMVRNIVVLNRCTLRNNKSKYGGAIFLRNTSNLTLQNSTIENNEATTYGGGLYFGGASGLISNCELKNNTSPYGGAMYIYLSGPLIKNCLIYSNISSTKGSGVYLNQTLTNCKIINTTIAENSSSGSVKDLEFSYATDQKPSLVNTLIWGSDIGSLNATYISIINSAIQGFTNYGDHTASISLSSNNTDSNGPNFTATDGSDWSIKFISPCRDIGVNSYTGVTIPSTDFDGNPRIGTKDIGAYEVQYSRWTGTTSTDWATATNWDQSVDPFSGTGDVVIPTGLSNYPTGSTTQDFTIASGDQMIIEQGASVTLDDLTNNGTLKLNHDASGFASLILGSYTDNGTEEIQLYLTGGYIGDPGDYIGRWHYISSPVSSLAVSTFAPGTTLDLAQFVESYPQFNLMEGWVAYDGYVYSTGNTDGPTFSTFSPGQGYNYWDNNDNTFTFAGALNTSDFPMSLGFSGDASLNGYNLLGNPYSSGLDWDDITNSVYYTYPSNTSKGLYFTRDNTQCTYINGVGTPSDVTGIIPPMQGFFTKTYSTGNTITLPAAARTHDNIHARYKGKSLIPLVRLSITENTISNDETVVRFDELAKSYLDNDFDAIKMFLSETSTTIHTALDGTDYAINGLPFPETVVEIPVVVNMTTAGTHKISTMQLQGLDDYNVTLTDNSTGFIADLKTTPVLTFASGAGLLDDRFVLKISNIATAVETPLSTLEEFNLFYGFNLINIQLLSGEWDGNSGSVRILDMTGKTITDITGIEFNRSDITQVRAPAAKGLYLVEIKAGVKRYVGKVVVK